MKQERREMQASADEFIAARVAMRFAATYSQEELAIIASFYQHKPAYRKRVFEELHLGDYGPDNPHVKKLVSKGLVKIRGNAMVLDKGKAKQVMSENEPPEKYGKGGWLDNYKHYFKKKEK